VPLSGVAKALDVDEDLLKTLNPAYKRGVVNGSPEFPKRLILPEAPPHSYSALYAVLNNPNKAASIVNAVNVGVSSPESAAAAITHRVSKGETLGEIANRYHVSVQDLRTWNGINKNI